MWPFKSKKSRYGLNYNKQGPISFDFTAEEKREIDYTFRIFEGYYIKPELNEGLVSLALSNYALELVAKGTETDKDLLERAGASCAKAYSVYQLPIYLYDLAVITEYSGKLELASDLFRKFLKAHSEYAYDSIANILLKNRKIDEAVSDTKSRLS